ncbi:MAG: tRNA adenosine(34) deaminase TadA [Gemmatimonadaceae bacterium]
MSADSGIPANALGSVPTLLSEDEQYIRNALDVALEARRRNEVPVGAIIVQRGAILSAATNRTIRDQDPTAHAEILAIREASSKLDTWRLDDCTLYVTLEPCAMCAGAIVLSRLKRVVFGAWDDKAGMAGSVGDLLRNPLLNHRPEVRAGVLADECALLLAEFFRAQRGTVAG